MVKTDIVVREFYGAWWGQSEAAVKWLRERGCRTKSEPGSRSFLVKGPRLAVNGAMIKFRLTPVSTINRAPAKKDGETTGGVGPNRLNPAPQVTTATGAAATKQEGVQMPAMRMRGVNSLSSLSSPSGAYPNTPARGDQDRKKRRGQAGGAANAVDQSGIQSGVQRPVTGEDAVPQQLMQQRPELVAGQDQARVEHDPVLQTFKVDFPTEQRARHFGSAVLKRVPAADVRYKGKSVHVRHRAAHAGEVFRLAAKSSARKGDKVPRTAHRDRPMGLALPPDYRTNWKINFNGSKSVEKAMHTLQLHGMRFQDDFDSNRKNNIFIFNKTGAEVRALRDLMIQAGATDAKIPLRVDNELLGAGRHPGSIPGSDPFGPPGGGHYSRYGDESGAPRTPYARTTGDPVGNFTLWAIEFGSVAVAALAGAAMQRAGIDARAGTTRGGLVAGLRDASYRVFQSIVNSFKGKARKTKTSLKKVPVPGSPLPVPRQAAPAQGRGILAPLPEPRPPLKVKPPKKEKGYKVRVPSGMAMALPAAVAGAYAIWNFAWPYLAQAAVFELGTMGIRAALGQGGEVQVPQAAEQKAAPVLKRRGGRRKAHAERPMAFGLGPHEIMEFVFGNAIAITAALAYLRAKGIRCVRKDGVTPSLVADLTGATSSKVARVVRYLDQKFDATIQRVPGVKLRPAEPFGPTKTEQALLGGIRKTVRGVESAATFLIPQTRRQGIVAALAALGVAATLYGGRLLVKSLTPVAEDKIKKAGGKRISVRTKTTIRAANVEMGIADRDYMKSDTARSKYERRGAGAGARDAASAGKAAAYKLKAYFRSGAAAQTAKTALMHAGAYSVAIIGTTLFIAGGGAALAGLIGLVRRLGGAIAPKRGEDPKRGGEDQGKIAAAYGSPIGPPPQIRKAIRGFVVDVGAGILGGLDDLVENPLVKRLRKLGYRLVRTARGLGVPAETQEEAERIKNVVVRTVGSRLNQPQPAMAFASYPWATCIRQQTKKYGKKAARKVCGKIKRDRGMSLEKVPAELNRGYDVV